MTSLTLTLLPATLVMTLNSDIYAQVRFTIHDKLANAGKLDLLVPLCESSAYCSKTARFTLPHRTISMDDFTFCTVWRYVD